MGRGTARRAVEGQCGAEKAIGNLDGIPQHVRGRNANQDKPALAQESLASFVPNGSIAVEVARPIDLDRELCRRTIEIEDIRTDGMLASKFDAVRVSKMLPKQDLGQAHLAAERTGSAYRICPSTSLRLVPLPTLGVGRN